MLTLLRYDYLILSPGAQQHKQREALSVIVDVALQIKSLGEKSGFRFLLAAFSPLDPRLLSGPSFFHPFVAAAAQNQIDFVDLTDFLKAHIPPGHSWEYFWPLDCHCTEKGYNVLARGIEDTLRTKHMLPEISNANPHVTLSRGADRRCSPPKRPETLASRCATPPSSVLHRILFLLGREQQTCQPRFEEVESTLGLCPDSWGDIHLPCAR